MRIGTRLRRPGTGPFPFFRNVRYPSGAGWPRLILVLVCTVFLSARAIAVCTPNGGPPGAPPDFPSLPLSGGIVLCDGVETFGFLRVRTGPFAGDPRDNLTVFVQGVVNQDDRSSGAGATNSIGNTIELEGTSHTLILNDGGSIKFGATITGAFPAISILGGSADALSAVGDGAFLNVTGGTVERIVLWGDDANATVSGGLLDLVTLQGANPVFNMTAGLIADSLTVSGDEAMVTIDNPTGLINGMEVIGTNASLVFDGAQSFDPLRVSGTNAVFMLNSGMIDGGAEIFGQGARLTNNTIINGGINSGGNAVIDNQNRITGEIFMTGPGDQLLNFGSATTSVVNTNVVFGAGAEIIVDNHDTISSSGNDSDAIVLEGDDSTVTNRSDATISTTGDDSTAVFFDSDGATVTNAMDATISTMGDGSSGVFIDGDGGTLNNMGSVTTEGEIAPALSVFGFNGVLDNEADVQTMGPTSFGLLLASRRDDAAPNPRTPMLTNGAKVKTSGEFSSAIVGVGADLEIINETDGEIVTSSSAGNAHGIVLGFQDPLPPLPIGIAIPLGVFDPAQGMVINEGTINTSGFSSAGIHAFANDSRIENRNSIVTTGAFSNGIDAQGDDLTIINDGTVRIENSDAAGIRVVGNDATVELRAMAEGGSAKNVTVLDSFVDGVNAMGDRLELIVEGLLVAGAESSEEATAVRFQGADAEIKINGMLNGSGLRPIGIIGMNAGGAEVVNDGEINIVGPDAVGIDITGDNVRVNNVGFDQTLGARVDAQIIVDGDNAVGVRTSGAGAFVSNRKSELTDATEIIGLDVSGEFARGIDVEATGDGGYLVENEGQIRIFGTTPGGAQSDEIVGMALRNPTNGALAFGQSNSQSSCLGSGMGAGLLNCGRLEVNGTSATAMLATGLSGSIVENSGDINGNGTGVTGIAVRTGIDAVRSTDNIVLSLEDIQLLGDDTTGISITGDGNVLMHGQDVIVLDVDTGAVDIPTIQVISVQVDRLSSIPGADSMPLADLFVSGNNAVGISVDGNDNVAAVSIVTQFIPLPGGIIGVVDAPATVQAQGTNSVAVRLAGNGNRLINMGRVIGDGLAIEGGDGNDHVTSFGTVVGRTELNGGNDTFRFAALDAFLPDNAPDRRAIRGDVDGGAGVDRLQLDTGDPFPNQDFFEIGTIDGDQFTNFETFDKLGDLPVLFDNSLELATPAAGVSTATIVDGGLILNPGSVLSAQKIEVQAGAEILGFGTLGVDPTGPGFVDRTTVRILDGGEISGGNSPGTLTIFGELELDGTLLTEIDGLLSGEFDQVNVLGDVLLGDTAVLDFVFGNGFAPQQGDMFEFLMATSVLGSLDLLDVNVFGLEDGFEFALGLGPNGVSLTALNNSVSQVPLPSTLLMFISGLLGVLKFARRRKI